MTKFTAQARLRAAQVAARLERALDAAEELKGGYEDLVGLDKHLADDWRLRSAALDAHITYLRAALTRSRKVAAGEEFAV